jgi:hypothetical protein
MIIVDLTRTPFILSVSMRLPAALLELARPSTVIIEVSNPCRSALNAACKIGRYIRVVSTCHSHMIPFFHNNSYTHLLYPVPKLALEARL